MHKIPAMPGEENVSIIAKHIFDALHSYTSMFEGRKISNRPTSMSYYENVNIILVMPKCLCIIK